MQGHCQHLSSHCGSFAAAVCAVLVLCGIASASLTIVTIPENQRGLVPPFSLTFDINNDGLADLLFEPAGTGDSLYTTRVTPLNGAQVLRDTLPAFAGLADLKPYVGDFNIGIIGPVPSVQPDPNNPWLAPSTNFEWQSVGYATLAYGFQDGGPNNGGNYYNVSRGYMAYSFMHDDERYYGWFEIGMQFHNAVQFYGYTYETTPGTPVYLYGSSVPEPGRAVLILAALAGVGLRRRRKAGLS